MTAQPASPRVVWAAVCAFGFTLGCAPSREETASEAPPASGVDWAAPLAEAPARPVAPVGYERAAWANAIVPRGRLLARIRSVSFVVDVFQVAVEPAPVGSAARAGSNEVVVLQYVFTNLRGAPIEVQPVPASLALNFEWDDRGAVPATDLSYPTTLYARHGVSASALASADGGPPPQRLTWEPGTSFAFAGNVAYRPDLALRLVATLHLADTRLLPDERSERRSVVTIFSTETSP